MRSILWTTLFSLLIFGGAAAYSQIIANSRFLSHTSVALRATANQLPAPTPQDEQRLFASARARALTYESELEKTLLVDGMVVNKLVDGEMRDQCDSLLFSSLRYVSLLKLGLRDKAGEAWAAIQNSKENGRWLRHPRCARSTSRDMLLGLLIALSEKPQGYAQEVRSLMAVVDENDGYFSPGPIYVSYLSPGLARFIALLAPHGGSPRPNLPEIIEAGYSTAELEVMVTEPGYESHLGALTAWLEMELADHGALAHESTGPILDAVETFVTPFVPGLLSKQRLAWITNRLVLTDSSNLFFRYLRLRAAGALTKTVRLNLLAELLAMPQFPVDRLPMNCDRQADYLWQRADRAAHAEPAVCSERFSGTDFLWMSSLLLEDSEKMAVAH